jgi:hypothetical protein
MEMHCSFSNSDVFAMNRGISRSPMNKSRCAAKYPSGIVLTKPVCFSKLSAVEIVKLDEIKRFIHDFKGERLRFSRIIWPLRSFITGLLEIFDILNL